MKKLLLTVLAALMLGTGCCTIAAVRHDVPWATPVTVPLDVVLAPVEFVGLEIMAREATDGQHGVMVFVAPFGDAK